MRRKVKGGGGGFSGLRDGPALGPGAPDDLPGPPVSEPARPIRSPTPRAHAGGSASVCARVRARVPTTVVVVVMGEGGGGRAVCVRECVRGWWVRQCVGKRER